MSDELQLVMAIWFFLIVAMGFAYFMLIFGQRRGDDE